MRDRFTLSELCEALAVSRSGYHTARQSRASVRAQSNARLLEQMKSIHAHRHTRCYGSPRMTRELQARGHACSKNRVARLMRLHGLRARPRRPFRPKTTAPDHAAHPSPNLLAQTAPAAAPGVQLVSDITYIPTAEGWLYLAVVIDLFSRRVLGWKLSETLHSELVTCAISLALDSGLVVRGAIFHSDRGCQYSAALTRDLLKRAGLRQSMSATGYCYDNAFAESAFASIKAELLNDGQPFATRRSAALAIFDYFECFYNRRRRHSALDYQSPNDFLDHYFHSLHSSLN